MPGLQVKSLVVTGIGVRITFDANYRDAPGAINYQGEAALRVLAQVTGDCEVLYNNSETLELVGQQENWRVNNPETLSAFLRGEGAAQEAGAPS